MALLFLIFFYLTSHPSPLHFISLEQVNLAQKRHLSGGSEDEPPAIVTDDDVPFEIERILQICIYNILQAVFHTQYITSQF